MTGLYLACKFGRFEIVQYLGTLTAPPVDFAAVDGEGKPPLYHAVETARNIDLVKFVWKKAEQLNGRLALAAIRNPWCGEALVKGLLGGRRGVYRRAERGSDSVMRELAVAAITCPFSTLPFVQAMTDSKDLDMDVLAEAAGSKSGTRSQMVATYGTGCWNHRRSGHSR